MDDKDWTAYLKRELNTQSSRSVFPASSVTCQFGKASSIGLVLFFIVILLTSCKTQPPVAKANNETVAEQSLVEMFSPGWKAAVRAALPSKYFAQREPSFQQTTNLLCRESRGGNNAARGLWGIVLLVQHRSQDEAALGLRLLRTSAEKGYVPAMLQLGSLFETGKYVHRDYNETFHWYREAADKGNAEAQLHLGGCYYFGIGTTTNLTSAAKYYRLASEQTNYNAMKNLGFFLINGMGVPKDIEAARYWLTRSAQEGGNRRAMYNLGAISALGFPETNAMADAFRWYKQSANLGDPLACLQLATFCYNGWGGAESNIDHYRDWRLKAATLGSTDAQYLMGAAYRLGDGVPQDTEMSLAWYRKAAAKHHPTALFDLALHYRAEKTNLASLTLANSYMALAAQAGYREAQIQSALSCFRGDVAPQDCEAGRRWLAMAAENGWAPAEFSLYQQYYYGLPPDPKCPAYPKDIPEAIKWLRRAADHHHLQAEATLAVILLQGQLLDRDTAQAEKLLLNAAEHGYAPAQNDLGFAILNGDILTRDAVEAAVWCQLAKSNSTDSNTVKKATANYSNALGRLNIRQQREIDDRVQKFRASPIAAVDPRQAGWETNSLYQQEDRDFGN